MKELGSGAVREVVSIRLSRAACMAIVWMPIRKRIWWRSHKNISLLLWQSMLLFVVWNLSFFYKGTDAKAQVQVVDLSTENWTIFGRNLMIKNRMPVIRNGNRFFNGIPSKATIQSVSKCLKIQAKQSNIPFTLQ